MMKLNNLKELVFSIKEKGSDKFLSIMRFYDSSFIYRNFIDIPFLDLINGEKRVVTEDDLHELRNNIQMYIDLNTPRIEECAEKIEQIKEMNNPIKDKLEAISAFEDDIKNLEQENDEYDFSMHLIDILLFIIFEGYENELYDRNDFLYAQVREVSKEEKEDQGIMLGA